MGLDRFAFPFVDADPPELVHVAQIRTGIHRHADAVTRVAIGAEGVVHGAAQEVALHLEVPLVASGSQQHPAAGANPKRLVPAAHLDAHHLLATCAGLALVSCGSETADVSQADIYTVTRGDLVMSVTEQAEIRPAVSTRIKNEMEGNTTIIYIIDEGSIPHDSHCFAMAYSVTKSAGCVIRVSCSKALAASASCR